MKKLLSIILVLVLALTMLTACGSNEQQPGPQEPGPSGEGVFPAVPKEDIKVGVIHIGNPADGSGYTTRE